MGTRLREPAGLSIGRAPRVSGLWRRLLRGCSAAGMRGLQRLIPSGPDPRREVLCEDLYGNTWRLDPNEFIQRQIFYLGTYEREEVSFLLRHLVRPAVIFDVGANVGFYSLTLARAFPDCIVHGFEPDPDIFRIFVENCRLNGLANVVVMDCALGVRNETLTMQVNIGGAGMCCKMCGMVLEDRSREFCSKTCRQNYRKINLKR